MRSTLLLVVAILLEVHSVAQQHVQWIVSTENAPWVERQVPTINATSTDRDLLTVEVSRAFQRMDGFGGCFNELGWEALKGLEAAEREKVLASLFSPRGADFNLGRMPIGANDFANGWYSLDETPDDLSMERFSIARDREDLLPFVKAAIQIHPGFAVWSVPWSPPTWMKTNGQYKGGEWKQDAATLKAYALYFSRYVQAYRAEGVPVFAVMPQNEPNYNNNVYPQAIASPELLGRFLRDYLAPQIKQDKLNTQIWLGTIVKPAMGYVDASLQDPVVRKEVTGVGVQWEGQQSLQAIHDAFPEKVLAQTETECYNGQNSWAQAMQTMHNMIADITHGASSYFYWNLVLDERGTSHWNWKQNSLVTVDRATRKVTYNPEFYALRHVSSFVHPGARRVAVHGSSLTDTVAFQNPDGGVVIVAANHTQNAMQVGIAVGARVLRLSVPPESMDTFVLPMAK